MFFPWLIVLHFILNVSANAPPPVPGIKFIPLQNLTNIGKRTTFRYRYFIKDGMCFLHRPKETHIIVSATNNVHNKALDVACRTLSKLTRHMPMAVFRSTASSYGVGIFTMDETLTVYPQFANIADRPECYRKCSGPCRNTCNFDGRKWGTVPGITNTISISNMETVLCMPRDIYQGSENIIVHEFAHLVHKFLPTKLQNQIYAAYINAKKRNMYRLDSYAMGTAFEYFAFAVETFFYSVRRSDTGTTGGINLCNSRRICESERESRQHLQRYDPMVFKIVAYAFTDYQPDKLSGLVPCEGVRG